MASKLQIKSHKTVIYETTDGREFPNNEDGAKLHQAKLEVFATLEDQLEVFGPIVNANADIAKRVIFGLLTDHQLVRNVFSKYQKRVMLVEKRFAKAEQDAAEEAA